MTRFQSPKGTQDILAPESARWSELVGRFAVLAQRFGFGLVVSPGFEDAEVFRRSSGDSSDVVTKEMYEFTDRGGRDIALRPEGTASVVRAFVQHSPVPPFKAWYAAPMFRYERPQAGRFRQHHQLGVETLGTDDPMADVEVISLLAAASTPTLDCRRCVCGSTPSGDNNCAPGYRAQLAAYLESHADELCDEHRYKWSANPLRILDCKRPECRGLSAGCAQAASTPCARTAACTSPRSALASTGSRITYEQDDHLVRGLDYYTRTTFEFGSDVLEGSRRRRPLRRARGHARWPGDVRRRLRRRHRADPARLRRRRRALPGDLRLSTALDAFVVDSTGRGSPSSSPTS